MSKEGAQIEVAKLKDLITRTQVVYKIRLAQQTDRLVMVQLGEYINHNTKQRRLRLAFIDHQGGGDAYEGDIRGEEIIQHTKHGTKIPDGRLSKYTPMDALTDMAFDMVFERGAQLMLMNEFGRGEVYGEWWVHNGESVMRSLADRGKDKT